MNLEYYDSELDRLEEAVEKTSEETLDDIYLEDVVIAVALKNQVRLQLTWELLSREISSLFDQIESELEGVYAMAIEAELKDSYKSSTISEAREFARANKEYRATKRVLQRSKYLKEMAKGIVETINSRKFVLNNLSNLIVHGSENYML
jgi:hypothetical protein